VEAQAMMNLRKHLHSAILGWGLAVTLSLLISAAGPQQAVGQAQSNPNPQNPDLTREQVATFDQFLDQHPDIDRQLRTNPSLVNNADFVEDHPDLAQFLASHKELSEELKENPRNFMHREQRFDRAENRAHNPNPDVTRQQVATFDQFLDQHPDIDRQLKANPSLINDADFVEDHPELGQFLASHKDVSEELKENPGDFMRREQRFDRAENRAQNPNPDVTRKEVASFDRFLDKHPDIDKQLDANPGLVNDENFLKNHHELRAFLKDHPEVREELRENPSDFMRREQRFDAAENNRARSQFSRQNPDLTPQEVADFDKFLDHHKSIDKDLSKNPNLVNDPKFLKDHHELQKFLEKNPEVSEELRENPTDFMRQESRFERSERDRRMDRHDRDRDLRGKHDKHDKDDQKIDRDDRDEDNRIARAERDNRDKDSRADKDDHKRDRDDHDRNARADKDHKKDRDHHKIADKNRHSDKDKHKIENKSALEEKEKLQTSTPH